MYIVSRGDHFNSSNKCGRQMNKENLIRSNFRDLLQKNLYRNFLRDHHEQPNIYTPLKFKRYFNFMKERKNDLKCFQKNLKK